jgi:hypothetical protein
MWQGAHMDMYEARPAVACSAVKESDLAACCALAPVAQTTINATGIKNRRALFVIMSAPL